MRSVSGKNRIIHNTFYLYLRMVLIMFAALLTSRVVLKELGVEDFGIYNVVGGLAVLFAFFSSSLSNATQRFLSYEYGKNDEEKARKIFSISSLIFFVISLIVVFLAETVGLWFVKNKLVIPIVKLNSALWVYHFTVFSLFVTLNGIVFHSVLIARENMKLYAYIGLLEAVLKLLIAYLLNLTSNDKLIFYAFLFFITTCIIQCSYAVYSIKKYNECRYSLSWDTSMFKRLFSFIGWNTVGTAVWSINDQGINILLNVFFGPAVNASRSIAYQVNSAVNNFSSNFYLAIKSQIIRSYAEGNISYFFKLIFYSSKYSFYLLWLICLPLLLRIEYVLELWLTEVPLYAIEFTRCVLICSLINILVNPIFTGVQAIGNLKKYTLIASSIFLLSFPLGFLFLKMGLSPISVFVGLIFVRFLYVGANLYVLRQMLYFKYLDYFQNVILPICTVVLSSMIIPCVINKYIGLNFAGILFMCFTSSICVFLSIYLLGLSFNERKKLNTKIMQYISILNAKRN